jgi:membrane protease YdiL (CAAX protease family)
MAWLMPTVRLPSWTGLAGQGAGTSTGMTTLLFALLLFPALEEFIFRRHLLLMLQSWLLHAGAGWRRPAWCFPALANVLCSLAFSALHWPVHGIGYALAVFVPSLVLGWLFLSYRSLPLTIAVHAYWNGLYLLFAPSPI